MTNDMPERPSPLPPAARRLPIAIGTVLVGAAIGFAGVYGIGGLKRNASGDPACRPAVDLARKLAPLAHGEVAALTMASAPLRLPDLSFEDAQGKPKKLSDWRGRTVLLNLWATWCVPCRKEMPALDSLQTRLGGPDFEVVAVNIDTRDPQKPKNFLKEANLTRLGYFTDHNARIFQDLKGIGRALGMPTSVLVDPQGCEIATIAGPAEWASDDAVKLIIAAMKPVAAGF
jgi:thiol-disulfide isomerase/thioredoxin